MKKFCILLILLIVFIPITGFAEETSIENDIRAIELDLVNHVFSENCYGRLYIPCVDINVALYITENGDGRAQSITDAKDSAAYRVSHLGGCGFIADHWNQGFINIKDIELKDHAYVFVKETNAIDTYECVYVCSGGKNGKELYCTYNDEYTVLSQIDWADWVAYTCDGDWTHVYMRFFKQLEDVV